MNEWDYDRFARREGFRSGRHRNDFYAGREMGGCLSMRRLERCFMHVPTPGGRRGHEVWLGPLGLIASWPPSKPWPLDWNWGWWR